MEQFKQSTTLSNGAIKLRVNRGAASEDSNCLGERSRSHNLNSTYTEGNKMKLQKSQRRGQWLANQWSLEEERQS